MLDLDFILSHLTDQEVKDGVTAITALSGLTDDPRHLQAAKKYCEHNYFYVAAIALADELRESSEADRLRRLAREGYRKWEETERRSETPPEETVARLKRIHAKDDVTVVDILSRAGTNPNNILAAYETLGRDPSMIYRLECAQKAAELSIRMGKLESAIANYELAGEYCKAAALSERQDDMARATRNYELVFMFSKAAETSRKAGQEDKARAYDLLAEHIERKYASIIEKEMPDSLFIIFSIIGTIEHSYSTQ